MPDTAQTYTSGLDTLSEYQLCRLTEGWTGPLHNPVQEDSVSGVASDETFQLITERWRAARDFYRDAEAESVFGEGATLSDGVVSQSALPEEGASLATTSFSDLFNMPFWADILLDVAVVAIVIGYMFCIYRYYHDVVALIYSSFRRSAAVSDRVNERRRSDIFYGFLGKLFLLGVGGVGVLLSIWLIRGGNMVVELSDKQRLLSPFMGMALFIVLVVVQYIILLIVGFVTRSLPTIHTLMRVRLTYFVFATVVVAPFLLVLQMSEGVMVWRVATCLAAGLTLMLYIRESLDLFISKKISILHWFLYLCTVEIVPITLLWQMAIRLR